MGVDAGPEMTLTKAQYDTARGNGHDVEVERSCRRCGKPIGDDRRKVYCSSRCSKQAKLEHDRQRATTNVGRASKSATTSTPRVQHDDGLARLVGSLLALDAVEQVELARDGWVLRVR